LDRTNKEDLVLTNNTPFKSVVYQKGCRLLWSG